MRTNSTDMMVVLLNAFNAHQSNGIAIIDTTDPTVASFPESAKKYAAYYYNNTSIANAAKKLGMTISLISTNKVKFIKISKLVENAESGENAESAESAE